MAGSCGHRWLVANRTLVLSAIASSHNLTPSGFLPEIVCACIGDRLQSRMSRLQSRMSRSGTNLASSQAVISKNGESVFAAGWYRKLQMPPAALRERSAGRCAGRIRCARQRSRGNRERTLRSLRSLGVLSRHVSERIHSNPGLPKQRVSDYKKTWLRRAPPESSASATFTTLTLATTVRQPIA